MPEILERLESKRARSRILNAIKTHVIYCRETLAHSM